MIDERYQDAASAISGSGPAYFALIIDALARAGVRQGLPREVAQRLAIQTMRGTAELVESTGQHPQAVIDAVSSPGGTTIAALEAMQRGGLPTALSDGGRCCSQTREGAGLIGMIGLASILSRIITLYVFLIIAYVLMSWIPVKGVLYDVYRVLGSIVQPYLGLFRRIIPPIGMVDISPIVAILVLQLVGNALVRLLATGRLL